MSETKEYLDEVWNSPHLKPIHGYQCPYCGSSRLKKFITLLDLLGVADELSQLDDPAHAKFITNEQVLCGDCWKVSIIALKE